MFVVFPWYQFSLVLTVHFCIWLTMENFIGGSWHNLCWELKMPVRLACGHVSTFVTRCKNDSSHLTRSGVNTVHLFYCDCAANIVHWHYNKNQRQHWSVSALSGLIELGWNFCDQTLVQCTIWLAVASSGHVGESWVYTILHCCRVNQSIKTILTCTQKQTSSQLSLPHGTIN